MVILINIYVYCITNLLKPKMILELKKITKKLCLKRNEQKYCEKYFKEYKITTI